MAETPTYLLKHPITVRTKVDGQDIVETVITELPYHKLRPKELNAADGIDGENAKTIALVAKMTGLTVRQVGEDMDLDDYQELAQATGGFIPGGQSTGGNASPT